MRLPNRYSVNELQYGNDKFNFKFITRLYNNVIGQTQVYKRSKVALANNVPSYTLPISFNILISLQVCTIKPNKDIKTKCKNNETKKRQSLMQEWKWTWSNDMERSPSFCNLDNTEHED